MHCAATFIRMFLGSQGGFWKTSKFNLMILEINSEVESIQMNAKNDSIQVHC